jgi:hypothetical protein
MMITTWRIFVIPGGMASRERPAEWACPEPLLAELSLAAVVASATTASKTASRAHLI